MMKTEAKIKRFHLTQRTNDIISKTLSYFGLVILSLVWIVPILWIILSALRTETNVDGDIVGIVVSNYFPNKIGFDNFINLLKLSH